MSRLLSKIIVMGMMWILPLLCTLLPLKVYNFIIKKGNNRKHIMGWMMCFGGGVFFATYILHMMPEVQRILGMKKNDSVSGHEAEFVLYNI